MYAAAYRCSDVKHVLFHWEKTKNINMHSFQCHLHSCSTLVTTMILPGNDRVYLKIHASELCQLIDIYQIDKKLFCIIAPISILL